MGGWRWRYTEPADSANDAISRYVSIAKEGCRDPNDPEQPSAAVKTWLGEADRQVESLKREARTFLRYESKFEAKVVSDNDVPCLGGVRFL